MKVALLLVLILNIIDTIFTSFVIANALAIEANPIMGAVLQYGIAPFIFVKLSIIVLSVSVLWRYRRRRITQIGTFVCLLVYSGLVLYFIGVLLNNQDASYL